MISYLIENDYEKIIDKEILPYFTNGDAKVLNVACEYRLIPEFLEGKINPSCIYGVDINEDSAKTNPNIRICDVDKESLPFRDSEFDYVISIWGLEHFKTNNIIRESRRILKVGGRMVFITPNVWNPAFFLNKLLSGWPSRFYFKHLSKSQYHPHKTYYRLNDYASIRRICKLYNFKMEKIIYIGPCGMREYFSFNRFAFNAVNIFEKLVTNRFLCYLKPYFICIIAK